MTHWIEDACHYGGIFSKTQRYLRICDRAAEQRGGESRPFVQRLSGRWAREILDLLAVRVLPIRGTPARTPVLLLGNHLSYLDIPLLLHATPTSFVAKREIAQWPVFGKAARCIETVFVHRESKDSRARVGEAVAHHIRNIGRSVTLFPSGTTTLDEEKPWRWGAFRIARDFDLTVQPFRIHYTPKRVAAYIQSDQFLPHLWRMIRKDGVEASIEFHEPIKIQSPERDCRSWQKWTQDTSTFR